MFHPQQAAALGHFGNMALALEPGIDVVTEYPFLSKESPEARYVVWLCLRVFVAAMKYHKPKARWGRKGLDFQIIVHR